MARPTFYFGVRHAQADLSMPPGIQASRATTWGRSYSAINRMITGRSVTLTSGMTSEPSVFS